MPRSVPRATFRPPGVPDCESVPTDSAGYAAAIADVIMQAVALDMVPPSLRIPTPTSRVPDSSRLIVMDGLGRLALVEELAADDRTLAWRSVLGLQPEIGATIRWLRILKAAEQRLTEADGHLAALRAKIAPVPAPPEPEPPPVPVTQDMIDALARRNPSNQRHKMHPERARSRVAS